MAGIHVQYKTFTSIAIDDGNGGLRMSDYVEELNAFLAVDRVPAITAIQHVEFLYPSRDAVMQGRADGARYLVTFGGGS